MKKISVILSLALCAALLLTSVGCAEDARVLKLGTSYYTIEIPAGMEELELTAEDTASGMVTVLYDTETLLSIDVFEISKDGIDMDLAAYVESEAKLYGGTDVTVTGGIGSYFLTTTIEGDTSITMVLILEDEANFIELGLTMGSDAAWDQAEAIIASLNIAE